MILTTIHLSITDDQLNALMAIRRAEIRDWGYPAINPAVESAIIEAGLVRIRNGGMSTSITTIGRLVLDSLGKESVCAS